MNAREELFISIPQLGDLYYDRILFMGQYPVLFTLKDISGNIFLCVCHDRKAELTEWILCKVSPLTVIKLLTNQVTLRKSFLSGNIIYFIKHTGGKFIVSDKQERELLNGDALPDDVFFDAEDGEFDEEILYYKSKLIPNKETQQAIDDSVQGRNIIGRFHSIQELMDELNS